MSLTDWLRKGWLIKHRTSPREVADLLAVVERDLADSAAADLSADWRLNIAYNAALQAATAALYAAGYRASRDAHHYRTIQSLALTIGAEDALVRQLEAFRKKRNIGEYERTGVISEQETKEMRDLAITLRTQVIKWLRQHHGDLLQ